MKVVALRTIVWFYGKKFILMRRGYESLVPESKRMVTSLDRDMPPHAHAYTSRMRLPTATRSYRYVQINKMLGCNRWTLFVLSFRSLHKSIKLMRLVCPSSNSISETALISRLLTRVRRVSGVYFVHVSFAFRIAFNNSTIGMHLESSLAISLDGCTALWTLVDFSVS
jgi:hypothetical protein